MNAVLMQAMGPTASMTGSATPPTGDFLSALTDALAPSASPDCTSVVAPDVDGEAVADVASLPSVAPMPSAASVTSMSSLVASPDTARSAAVAYAATDVAAESMSVQVEPSTVPTTASGPADSVDALVDDPVEVAIDQPCGLVDADPEDAAATGVDAAGRLARPANSVDDVHDDATQPEARDDLASRLPVAVGAAVERTPSEMPSPAMLPWSGHGPVDVAADVRPVLGHGSLGRPGAHSVHGPMVRPGWQHGAVAAQALALRGDAALQAVGQYVAGARPPALSHVRPVVELRGVAAAGAPVGGTVDRTGQPIPVQPMPTQVPPAAVLAAPLAGSADVPAATLADGPLVGDTDRPAAVTRHGQHATAVGESGVIDRTPSIAAAPAPVADISPNGAAQVRPAVTGPVGVAAQRTPHPGGLGMIGTDRVDRVRQQTAGRPVQRLTVDLDDARVAVRMRGAHVSVDVLSDPSSTLGQTWAHDVERTLESAMRAQETAPGRLPVERDRLSTAHSSAADQRHDGHRGSGSDRRDGDQSGREHRRAVPWWLTEDDE